MRSCNCDSIADHFDEAHLEERLAQYRKGRLPIATQILLGALSTLDLQDLRLLDIGGGSGTIMQVLFAQGIRHATLVEIADAYLDAAKRDARDRGLEDQVEFLLGDFVEIADRVGEADLVTLDRVVCCYPHMPSLVGTSISKAVQWYALSHPRDTWWARFAFVSENWLRRLKGDPFTAYVHDVSAMESIIEQAGFRREFHRRTWFWEVAIFRRVDEIDPVA